MTKRFEVITDSFEISIKDKAVRDYPFSIQCENIDEFEPLLQEVINVNARLNKTWEQTQRFDKYSQEYLQRANQLEKENEQLKQSNQKLNDELQETMGYLALKSGVEKENEQLKKENQRMTDKLNELALEFLNYDMVTMGKATEISEMCYYDFLKYRKDNGNPMELQV